MVTIVEVPRQVDHEERRREIIEALFRVATRDGLGAASVRAVAKEAGVPAPRVQYYFPTKTELLDAAMLHLGQRVVGRGLALQRAAGPDATPETLLRAALGGSRPVDASTRHDIVLFFLFFIAALTDEVMADTQLVQSQRFIGGFFTGWIREAQERGEADPSLDPEHEARLILFGNTGLILAALAGVLSIDEAVATIDDHLARVFRAPPASEPRQSSTR